MRAFLRDRLYGPAVVLSSAASVGLAARFVRAVLTPPPPLTVDWTPAVYGAAGFLFSAFTLQLTLRDRVILPPTGRRLLVALNGSCFAGYLALIAVLFWRSLVAAPD